MTAKKKTVAPADPAAPSTIKITRHRPAACACIIEYSWDSAVSEDERVHTPHKIVDCCPAHQHLVGDVDEHFKIVNGENCHRGAVLQSLDEHLKQRPETSWNDKRELIVHLPTDCAKADIKKHIAEKFADTAIHIK
jgi:hypothetical protein